MSSPSTLRTRVRFLSYDEGNCGASESSSRQRRCPRSLLTKQSLYQLGWHRIGFQSGPVLPSRIPAIPRSPRLQKGRHGCRSVRVISQPRQCMRSSRRQEQKARLSQSAPTYWTRGRLPRKCPDWPAGAMKGEPDAPAHPLQRLIRPGGAAPSERGRFPCSPRVSVYISQRPKKSGSPESSSASFTGGPGSILRISSPRGTVTSNNTLAPTGR